jgi:hypothetical protein
MRVWQSRDAYRVQSFFYGLLAVVLMIEGYKILVGGNTMALVFLTLKLAALQCLAWVLRWFSHGVLLALMMLSCGGCALWFQQTHPPVERTLIVSEPPDAAFRRALLVTTDLGCTLWTQDRQTRTLQAFYRAETQLTVTVQPQRRGSLLQVVHQNLPTYVGQGNDGALSDMFLSRYSQSLAAQGK